MAADKLWQYFQVDLSETERNKLLVKARSEICGPQAALYANPYFARPMEAKLPKRPLLPRPLINIIAEYGATDDHDMILSVLESPIVIKTGNCSCLNTLPIIETRISLTINDGVEVSTTGCVPKMTDIPTMLRFIFHEFDIEWYDPSIVCSLTGVMNDVRIKLRARIEWQRKKMHTF